MKRYFLLLAALLAMNVQGEDVKLDIKTIRAQHRISVYSEGVRIGIGTGIAIDKRHLLTANHVVNCKNPLHMTSNANSVWVDINDEDGDEKDCSIPARIVKSGGGFGPNGLDLALIETDADLDIWVKPKFGEVKVGDICIAIGAAFAWCPYSQYVGTFTARHCDAFPQFNQLACTAIRGMSGGGIYSTDGKLIGICIMARGEGEVGAVMLAIPSAAIKAFLESK